MALNRVTLDVSGRLSLLGPQPEVLQILKRAGIHNILRIFDSEAELLKTSEEIILQTSSFNLGDLKNLAQQQTPQSEFDQLRSEISSVFSGSSHDHDEVIPPPPKTKSIAPAYQEPAFTPPPQQPASAPITDSSIEQEFDDAFRQFESDDSSSGFDNNQYPGASATGGFVPPSPVRGGFNQPVGQFQNRQYMPQQPMSPVPPSRPVPPPQAPVFDSVPKAPARPTSEFSTGRNDRFQPAAPIPPRSPQPPVSPSPVSELDGLDEEIGPIKSSKASANDDAFDESDDDFFDEGKKKSPVPVIAIVVLLLVLGGVGVFFAYNMLSKKPAVQPPVTTTQTPAPVTPPTAAVDSTKTDSTKAASEKPVETAKVDKKEDTPQRVKQPAAQTSRAKPKAETNTHRAPAPTAKSTPAVTENKVVITSSPSGAKVTINGDYMGITPYTWDKPIFGPLSVVISKDGYEDDSKVFEFTGGNVRESFSLRKAAITAPPPVTRAEPEPESFSLPEPEPEPEPVRPTAPAAPVVAAPSTPPPQPTPVSSGISGGDASIFIASIPPVADVFLDGKLIGKTNVSEIKLPPGTHNLKFVKGVKETTKAITVQPGKNPSQMVRLQ